MTYATLAADKKLTLPGLSSKCITFKYREHVDRWRKEKGVDPSGDFRSRPDCTKASNSGERLSALHLYQSDLYHEMEERGDFTALPQKDRFILLNQVKQSSLTLQITSLYHLIGMMSVLLTPQ